MRTPPAGVSRIDSRLVRSRRPLPQDPCTGVAALPSAAAMPEPGPPGSAGSTATESQPWPSTLGAIIGSPITSDDPAEPATPNELYVTDPAGGEEDEENVIEPEFGGRCLGARRIGRQRAGNQHEVIVHARRYPVHTADEGTLPAADHAIADRAASRFRLRCANHFLLR